MPTIAIIYPHTAQRVRAETLAATYQLPCRPQIHSNDDIGLYIHAEHLSLKQNQAHAGDVLIDFSQGKTEHRRRYGGGRKQPLARALGLHKQKSPLIFDATAGWGRDAWVLASLGAQIYLGEQQPLLRLLLEDALNRAQTQPEISPIAKRLQFITSHNSIDWLNTQPKTPLNAIYLDPMYPKRKKSAAVKKDMHLLQALYSDTDSSQIEQNNQQLLQAALAYPCPRVVVKRPLNAEPLANMPPQAQIKSKHTRYDLYLN